MLTCKRTRGFTLVEIMIVVAIIGILLGIAIPSFLRARETARGRACQENLQKIDSAKEQWAIETNRPNDYACDQTWTTWVGADKYIKKTPICPAGGTYTINNIGTDPTCNYTAPSWCPAQHTLP